MTREEVKKHLNILLANRCWHCRYERAENKVCDERCMFKQAINEATKALQDRLTGEWIKHEIEGTFKAHLKDAEERTTEVYEYDDFQYAYFLGKAKAYDEVIRRLGGVEE